jgi:cytochrome b561
MTTASPWTAPPAKLASRYSTVAMALHWLIAALIAVQLGLGWYMNEVLPDHTPPQVQMEGLHISVGLTLMLVIVARIVWRLLNPPPALPDGLAPWEKVLSRTIHAAFYLLMVILPLTGWALVSGGKKAISWWGLNWPKLPGLAALTKDQHHLLKHTHIYTLIWILVISWFLHVGGALKHQFDGKPVLWRMIPFLKPPSGS